MKKSTFLLIEGQTNGLIMMYVKKKEKLIFFLKMHNNIIKKYVRAFGLPRPKVGCPNSGQTKSGRAKLG